MSKKRQAKEALPLHLKGRRGEIKALAEHYGVSRKTIGRWRKAGVDTWEESVVRAHIENLAGSGPTDDGEGFEGKTLTEIRAEKESWQVRLLRLRFAKEEGELISRSKAEEEMYAAGSVNRQMWMRIENDLPAMLEGQTIAQMQKTCREYARSRLAEMADVMSGIYDRCVERD